MIKRIIVVILFIPIVFTIFPQLVYDTIRWIITGKEFHEPLPSQILDKLFP